MRLVELNMILTVGKGELVTEQTDEVNNEGTLGVSNNGGELLFIFCFVFFFIFLFSIYNCLMLLCATIPALLDYVWEIPYPLDYLFP
jgi:hypothetical protein